MVKLDSYLKSNSILFRDLDITPAFEENNVTIVYSSSDTYAKYLSVSILSLLKNSDPNKNYDIIVIETRMPSIFKQKIENSIKEYKNAKIRFLNLKDKFSVFHPLFYIKGMLGYETYYRLFLDKILKNYDKVLYLDADTVVLQDINELFDMQMSNYLIAGVLDITTISQATKHEVRENLDVYTYINSVLEIDFNKYLQCGVLLFNLAECRKFNFSDKAIETLYRIPSPFYVDQDIINVICQNKILYLSPEFNFMALYKEIYVSNIRPDFKLMIEKAKQDIKVLHLTGPKPDKYPAHEFAELFWKYARLSPFYETFIFDNIIEQVNLNNPLLKNTWNKLATSILSNIENKQKYKRKMRKYKFIYKITFGSIRKKYKQKYKNAKQHLKEEVI